MNRTYPLIFALLLLLSLAGCGDSSAPAGAGLEAQRAWVRAHLDDVYLWRGEIVDVPPANYASAPDYFDALLVKAKDRFSFSMPKAVADSELRDGLQTGFGVKWGWGASGRLFAYYVDPYSPAAGMISRGTEVISINGWPVAQLASSSLNAALFPGKAGASTSMVIRSPGTSVNRPATLVSANFSITPVAQPLLIGLAQGKKAGYLLFNDHILTAEQGLVNAMTYFKQQGVSEVVLDLRYNGGGFLHIAEEVASMLGGSALQGQVFERLLFNDRHPERTNDPQNTVLFSPLDQNGATLPQLGLRRVFVITGSNTCSASESIINGLLPYLPVIRIGTTTCGKPYGSVQTDYEGQAYFALQVEGVNANGLDDYKTGFLPTCQVADDLKYPLGDIRAARLSAAIYYMNNTACPATGTVSLPKAVATDQGDVQLIGPKPALKIVQ